MAAYLLTWNPDLWPWPELADNIRAIREHGHVDRRWSCGTTRGITRGDRVFLMRQAVEPRGIVAAGTVLADPCPGDHWEEEKRGKATAWFVRVRFDTIADPRRDRILPRALLLQEFGRLPWDGRPSGRTIPPEVVPELERLWAGLVRK